MRLNLTNLLFVSALIGLCSSLNWMAGGSFTQENFDILRAKINAFDTSSTMQTIGASADQISSDLNTLWAEAWNVVIPYYTDGKNYDSILYGYAFNGHWFWFNGFHLVNNNYISFIIWKDYNCITWYSFNPIDENLSQSTFSDDITSSLTSGLQVGSNSRDVSDIWLAAQSIQDLVIATPSIFTDKLAYSIIASQSSTTIYFGRFCVHNYAVVYETSSSQGNA